MWRDLFLLYNKKKNSLLKICLLLMIVTICGGCGKGKEAIGREIKVDEKVPIDLRQYNSPYTYGEALDDGTYDFYIYASPIQWKKEEQYQLIDNRLVKSEKEGYEFENAENQIKTYFPSDKKIGFLLEKGEEYFYAEIPQIMKKGQRAKIKNIYGEEKEAICYTLDNGGLLYAYPVYSGIHFECVYPDGILKDGILTMQIEKQRLNANEISDEYLQFSHKEMKVFLYQPFFKQEGDRLKQLSSWELDKNTGNGEKVVETAILKMPEGEKKETHLEFSLLWDVEAMPDSTIYEKKDENVFSARSAFIGKGKETGIGQHYLRYRFNYFYQIKPEDILEAEYNVKNLNGDLDMGKPALHEPVMQWSSTRLCWDEQVAYSKEKQNQGITLTEDGWYCFDITDFTKRAVEDYSGITESLGSVLVCDNGSALLATSDNGEFIPYIKLHLKTPPEYFIEHESINEVDW